jgi:hypothetical protein
MNKFRSNNKNLLLCFEEFQNRDIFMFKLQHGMHCREDLLQKRFTTILDFEDEDSTCIMGSDIKFIVANGFNGLYPVPFNKRM